ncbi:MAG: preprotein translocase subunit SecE [bacterium]|nr:preprotein translocase subunit SecE [bacterium]
MNIVTSTKNYLVSAYIEMTKVTWPTKKQTINYSLLVILFSLGMAAVLGLLDNIFSWIINLTINR